LLDGPFKARDLRGSQPQFARALNQVDTIWKFALVLLNDVGGAIRRAVINKQ